MYCIFKAALTSLCLFVVLFSTQGCSGSGNGSTPGPDNTALDQLATSLVRQSGDTTTITDLWRCIDIDLVVRYFALVESDDGEAVAFYFPESSTNAQLNTEFQWEIDGQDSLNLYEQNGQLHDSFSYIVFSTERSLSLNSSANGYLSCMYLTGDEITRVSASELTPGDVLSSDQMLPVVPPDGFVSMLTYNDRSTAPSGFIVLNRTVKAVYEDTSVPTSIRNVFMYGPERFVVSEYLQLEGSTLYANFEPFDLSDEAVKQAAYRADAWLLDKGVANERIEGCFEKVKRFDVENFGTSFLISSSIRWCFNADGSFAVGNGESLADRRSSVLQPDLFSRGRYRIDGYAIRLLFDSGLQAKGGFGWMDRAEKRVYLLNAYPILE